MNIDQFIQAYITCALWASTDDQGEPLDAAYSIDDIHAVTLVDMHSDCIAFLKAAGALLDASGMSSAQAGHDFWLSRNGHGAGFYDRGLRQCGEDLHALAAAMGSADLYVGDDQQLHSV